MNEIVSDEEDGFIWNKDVFILLIPSRMTSGYSLQLIWPFPLLHEMTLNSLVKGEESGEMKEMTWAVKEEQMRIFNLEITDETAFISTGLFCLLQSHKKMKGETRKSAISLM